MQSVPFGKASHQSSPLSYLSSLSPSVSTLFHSQSIRGSGNGNRPYLLQLAMASTATVMTETETKAILRFSVPDQSVTAEERSLFAFPANKSVVEETLSLHNFYSAPDARDATDTAGLVKGRNGLDVQGFTYVKHRSALSDSGTWFEGKEVERLYIPEVEKLICEVTGAKTAVVANVAIRRRLADE
jgi:hypothetical protein